ncbi:MAG: PepSY1/2 domain-containing protein [Eubacteriales bacterium]
MRANKAPKIYLLCACYLAAFAVIGAGFALCARIADKKYLERERAANLSTLADGAEQLEALSDDFKLLFEVSESDVPACLAQIRLDAELAQVYFGRISFDTAAHSSIMSFLSACSELSSRAFGNGIAYESENITETVSGSLLPDGSPVRADLLYALGDHASRLADALPTLTSDIRSFEEKVNGIFGTKELDTLLFEDGYSGLAAKNEFSLVSGEPISAEEAISLSRAFLGSSARLSAEEISGEIPLYTVYGKNISALISKNGGCTLQFLFDLPEGEKRLSETEAEEKAVSFLSGMKVSADTSAPYETEYKDGVFFFTYLPVPESGILCLDEPIRLGVSHGSGRIVLYDALEYYRHHSGHLIKSESFISAEEISALSGSDAKPLLCKISTPAGTEAICYMLKDGERIRFFSPVTGRLLDYKKP